MEMKKACSRPASKAGLGLSVRRNEKCKEKRKRTRKKASRSREKKKTRFILLMLRRHCVISRFGGPLEIYFHPASLWKERKKEKERKLTERGFDEVVFSSFVRFIRETSRLSVSLVFDKKRYEKNKQTVCIPFKRLNTSVFEMIISLFILDIKKYYVSLHKMFSFKRKVYIYRRHKREMTKSAWNQQHACLEANVDMMARDKLPEFEINYAYCIHITLQYITKTGIAIRLC